MSDQNKVNSLPELAGIWRSIVLHDISKLDDTLVSLIKQGRQVIHVSAIPNEFVMKEPTESWKEEPQEGKVNVAATNVLIIYLEPVLQEEWLKTVRDNVVKIDDIR